MPRAAAKSGRVPVARPSRRLALVLGALALGAAAALAVRSRLPGERHGPAPAAEAGLSVLLITIDTLRADAVGAYGDARAMTPWMDRLAAGGVRFDAAHAQNVVTLASHANILSGGYPWQHGVRDNAGFRFPAGRDTLATLLRGRGYRTGAFVSAFPLDARFGLARGFDVYDDRLAPAPAGLGFVEPERSGAATVALARRWLAGGSGPSFCWIHLYEPHYPYRPPEPLASRFAGDPYRGEVAAADAALAPLLEPILAAGTEGKTLVVLTADHGESLGEHGEATHGVLAYEATLRVPLLVFEPRLFRPRAVAEGVRHVDLLPTILEALAIPVPPGLPGRSLLPDLAGGAPGPAATSYFEALSGQLHRGWAPVRGVIVGRSKFIELPIPELYDLASDPGEASNLAAQQPARVAELRARLAELHAEGPRGPAQAEDAETRERLRSLGYASARAEPKRAYGEDDDPKRLMPLDAVLQEVARLALEGRLAAATARCRELVKARPTMPLSLLYLAHLERESGNLAAGIDALTRAVALSPDDATAVAALGTYLTQAGRAREAVERLEPFAEREPDVEVLTALGLALAKLGRFADALASLDAARSAAPRDAMILVETGTVQLMAGEERLARDDFEAALALDPDSARAHSSLGALLAEAGHAAEAVEHWRRATALDPGEWDRLLGVGVALLQAGQTAPGRAALEFFVANAPASQYRGQIGRAQAALRRNAESARR